MFNTDYFQDASLGAFVRASKLRKLWQCISSGRVACDRHCLVYFRAVQKPASFRVVRVSLDDLPALQQLSRRTFYDTFAAFNTAADMQHYLDHDLSLEQLQREFECRDTEFYLAYSTEGACAGFLKLHFQKPSDAPFEGSALEIVRIYLDIPYFGSGLAPQLLQLARERAMQQHCSYLWLGVWEHNPRAIRFYEKQGFKPFGSTAFMLGSDRQTDILMALRLSEI